MHPLVLRRKRTSIALAAATVALAGLRLGGLDVRQHRVQPGLQSRGRRRSFVPGHADRVQREVTITAKPTRIVSLSPTATEDLYAVGAGPQVVAVDKDSDYPATTPMT